MKCKAPAATRCTPALGELSTLRDIVAAYIRDKRAPAAMELQYYAN